MPEITAATATRVAEIRPTKEEAESIEQIRPAEFFTVVEDAFQALLLSIEHEIKQTPPPSSEEHHL